MYLHTLARINEKNLVFIVPLAIITIRDEEKRLLPGNRNKTFEQLDFLS